MAWETMDTAPRDGKPILLFVPGRDDYREYWEPKPGTLGNGIIVGWWDVWPHGYERAPYGHGTGPDGWVSHISEPSYEDSIIATVLSPTHWMPLPGPPRNTVTPGPAEPLAVNEAGK